LIDEQPGHHELAGPDRDRDAGVVDQLGQDVGAKLRLLLEGGAMSGRDAEPGAEAHEPAGVGTVETSAPGTAAGRAATLVSASSIIRCFSAGAISSNAPKDSRDSV